jgi:hypothetical protein
LSFFFGTLLFILFLFLFFFAFFSKSCCRACTANERVTLVPGPFIGYKASSVLMTVSSFALGAMPVGLYLRSALIQHATFDDALPFLKTTFLASPMYIIVGGASKGQGGIITRDRKGISRSNQFGWPIEKAHQGVNGPAWMFDTSSTLSHAKCQTNWDPWITTTASECRISMSQYPAWKTTLCNAVLHFAYNDSQCEDVCQLYSDGRKEGGTADLTERLSSSPATKEMVYSIMSNRTSRVLNGETKFTSVMNSFTNYYNTTVRVWGSNQRSQRGRQRKKDDELVTAGRLFVKALLKAMG